MVETGRKLDFRDTTPSLAWVLPVIMISLLLLMVGCGGNTEQVKFSFIEYKEPDIGIRVEYPRGWSIELNKKAGGTGKIEFSGEEGTTCSVIAVPLEDGATLDQYLERIKEIYKNFGVHEYEDSTITLGGLTARQIIYDMKDIDGNKLRNREVYIVKDDRVYSVGCSALKDRYSSYTSLFETFINSFGFI